MQGIVLNVVYSKPYTGLRRTAATEQNEGDVLKMTPVKRIIYYLLYITVVVGLFIFAQWVTIYIKQLDSMAFINPIPCLLASLVNILPGLALGLEHISRERSQSGSWKVEWVRLMCLGVPAFYIDFSQFISSITRTFPPLLLLPANFSTFLVFGGVVLGYVLITSFKKKPVIVENNLEF
ncbi:MAG: hypothetical protein ACM3MK_00810 [Chitinophagales bacterium]